MLQKASHLWLLFLSLKHSNYTRLPLFHAPEILSDCVDSESWKSSVLGIFKTSENAVKTDSAFLNWFLDLVSAEDFRGLRRGIVMCKCRRLRHVTFRCRELVRLANCSFIASLKTLMWWLITCALYVVELLKKIRAFVSRNLSLAVK